VIDERVHARLGAAVPSAAAPESEALRRFRSFAASALLRGRASDPALDGLRADERSVASLLGTWSEAAADVAGGRSEEVRAALEPLLSRFRAALRATTPVRRKSGAPRTARRAVMAAIDRIADVFLAVDVATGRIADANPAAGAILGVLRDELLEADLSTFAAPDSAERWRDELDAMSEGDEPRRFEAALRDSRGVRVDVEVRATRHLARARALAIFVARPI
jgi:PAS domain S-box-containing protein